MKHLYFSFCTLLSFGAAAQPSRAWQDVRPVGPGTEVMARGTADAAGNFYEVGQFSSSTVIDGVTLTCRGSTDAFLAKYTPQGTLAWVKQFGTSRAEDALGVAVDAAGNVFVVGEAYGTLDLGNGVALDAPPATPGRGQGFVARFSSQGTAVWALRCSSTSWSPFPAGAISVDAAGHVYVAGGCQYTATVGPATLNTPAEGVYVAQLSAAGVVQWVQQPFRYTTSPTMYRPPQLATGPAGDTYLLVPYTGTAQVGSSLYPSLGEFDNLIVRLTAQGLPQWAQQYGGSADDWLKQAAVDGAGNVYVGGHYYQPMQVGSVLLPAPLYSDTYVAKYSAAGVAQWARRGGGNNEDIAASLVVDAAGNSFLTGYFTGTATYGSFALSNPAAAYPSTTAMVVAYSPQGTERWAEQAQGSGSSGGLYLGLDAAGSLHLLGRAGGSTILGGLPITSAASFQSFLARLDRVLAVGAPAPLALGLYPNPATDAVQLPALPPGAPVQILDARGRLVRTSPLTAGATLSVRNLAPGLYLLRALDAQGQPHQGRLVVE